MKFNFRNKGLLFMTVLSLIALLIGNYALTKKFEINLQLSEAKNLESKSHALQNAQLSAYNAVAELIVIFQAQSRDEAINITHEKFLNLLVNYEKITEIYPNKKDAFTDFLRSLADSIKKPTPQKLQSLAKQLSSFQSELDLILKEVRLEHEALVTGYTDGLSELLVNIILAILTTIIFLAVIVSIFFRRLTGDIKTLNFSLGRVLYSSSQPIEIQVHRTDEVQQLAERITELSDRLRKREQSLSLEQRQRAHLEQNKALEHLTRGLVHAIGNPVTGLLGLIQYLTSTKPEPEELQQSLLAMDESAQKLMSINEDLKLLSARTGRETELLDLNLIIAEQHRLMVYDDNWFGVDISIIAANNLPVFSCSKDDVAIILENLLENSHEAFHRSSKADHKLAIETIKRGEAFIGFVITDNAGGMSPEVQEHAMDAFYSTKKGFSQGDGMGLLSCLNLVEKYGGNISLNSKVGVGTSVTVLFPVYENQENNLKDLEKNSSLGMI